VRPGDRSEALDALARKDEATLARVAAKGKGDAAARRALPALPTLYGDGALARARALAKVVPAAAAALGEVESAIRAAGRKGIDGLAVDLGEVRGLGYYTGVTVVGHASGAGSAVASGGRYDELLARFGRPGPAIGFAVDLEFATQALERAGKTGRGRAPQRAAARRRRR
jgi:ATP phosphoribosyltransferase regulatory subunit